MAVPYPIIENDLSLTLLDIIYNIFCNINVILSNRVMCTYIFLLKPRTFYFRSLFYVIYNSTTNIFIYLIFHTWKCTTILINTWDASFNDMTKQVEKLPMSWDHLLQRLEGLSGKEVGRRLETSWFGWAMSLLRKNRF